MCKFPIKRGSGGTVWGAVELGAVSGTQCGKPAGGFCLGWEFIWGETSGNYWGLGERWEEVL